MLPSPREHFDLLDISVHVVFSNDAYHLFSAHVLPELLNMFLGPRVQVVLQDQSAEEKYHIGTWHVLLTSEVCFGFDF